MSTLYLNSINSQTIFSAAKPFKVERGKYLSEINKDRIIDSSTIRGFVSTKSLRLFATSGELTENKEKRIAEMTDSLNAFYKRQNDSLEYRTLMSIIDTLNKTSELTPLFTAGISNLEDTKQAYGSLSLGLQFRLSKYKINKNKWIDPHFLYLIFSAKTASSPDSSSIQKTLLFPELNKRDFVLGYFWQCLKNDWAVSPTFEFSLNKFSDTSNSKSFVSQSFTTGVRVQKSFNFDNINSFVSLFPYYSLITVDKKFSEDYKDLTGETKIPSSFHSLGLNVSAQFPNAILFCNMKYILNKEGELKSRDLKRFVYTIGTLLSL